MKRGLVLIVLGGPLVVWPALGYVREFVAVDTCLDAGGSFDYTQSRCDHADAFVAYSDRHPTSSWIAAAGAVVLATDEVRALRRESARYRS
jgi:hypothetical protein